MKRITTGVAVALATLALATTACSKKDDKAANGAAAPGTPAAAVAAATAGSPGGYAVFPADSEFVMSFSIAGLRASPLWTTKLAPLVQAKMDAEMAKVKEACGIDPFAKFDSVLVGGKPGDEKNMVIVVKGFTKAEMSTCGAALAKKEGKEFAITEENGLTKLKAEGDDMYVAFLDDTTALMSPNPDAAWVKARAAGENGLTGNAAFMELLKNVDTSGTVFFAALPAPGSEMDASKMSPGAKAFFGSLKVNDGLAFDIGLRHDTPANATTAEGTVKGGLAQAKAMMPPAVGAIADKAKISVKNSDLVIQLQLSTADLDALFAALGPMMGGMMGGAAIASPDGPAGAPGAAKIAE